MEAELGLSILLAGLLEVDCLLILLELFSFLQRVINVSVVQMLTAAHKEHLVINC